MKKHPDHSTFEADFKAFLDGELSFWRRFQVRRHLQSCPHCREEIRIMQTIEQELRTEEIAPLGADLRAKILDSAPVESPADAPKPRARLVPQVVFGFASLAVFAALISYPAYQGFREYRSGVSKQSVAKAIGLDRQKYAQNDSESPQPMAGAAAARAAPNAAPLSNYRRSTGRSGASFSGDARSLDGYGNKIYLENVVPAQRQVHKQGSLSVTVDDAEAKGSAVEITIKNVGGFVAQNSLSTGADGRKTATLDVRVPVAQLETVVAKIGKLGTVREKSVNGEDITARVTQAGARRQSLSRELSVREAQLRAAKSKDKAAIVRDVRQLRFQANQARAQLEYLRKYAALATLFVTLQDKPKVAPIASSTGDLGNTARMAWSSFLASAQLPLQLLIWIAAYAPLWIPALLIWRKFGRKAMGAS